MWFSYSGRGVSISWDGLQASWLSFTWAYLHLVLVCMGPYCRDAFPNTVEMPSNLIAGW